VAVLELFLTAEEGQGDGDGEFVSLGHVHKAAKSIFKEIEMYSGWLGLMLHVQGSPVVINQVSPGVRW
jgi:hypothetical protein